MILNLVTNAADALGDGDGRIALATDVVHLDAEAMSRVPPEDDRRAGEYVRLTVRDDGCGMDAETAARIFDPFFTTKVTGRGLGLAAVQGIVRKHGGVISLDSKLGEGTTFTVLLPTVPGTKRGVTVSREIELDTSNRCILIADDEGPLRSILSRRLRYAGFDVIEAADGQQAIDEFRRASHSIDCVLLDLSMPKRSGEEVAREIHAIRKDVPMILMSGYTEKDILDRFDEGHLAGVLQKPVLAKDLIEAVRKALHKKRVSSS